MFISRLQVRCLSILSFLILCQIAFSQTITSKAAGGRWNDPATWTGGTVPTAANDVVIIGPVNYRTGDGACRNLTINAGGSLFNYSDYYTWSEQFLSVSGSITNNGTLYNADSRNLGLVLRCAGSVTNNGTWTCKRLELVGTGSQTLTEGASNRFDGVVLVDTTARPTVVAASNLAFGTTVDLSKSTLDMKSFAVTLYSNSGNISNGTVINAKDIIGVPTRDQYTAYYPIINNITYDGNPNIKGRVLINSNVTLKGAVTVSDTVEELTGYYEYEKTLWIKGNLINNGIIRTVGSHGGLLLNVTGNITNNGRWVHTRTDLSGTSNQTLTLAPNKLFEAAFRVTDSLGMIVAGSNLATTSWFDLRKCVLDVKNYSLTLQGSGGTVYNGFVINVRDIIGVPSHDASYAYYPILDNVTYDGNPNIKGRVLINSNVTLKGAVTVSDTVEEKTGYYDYEKTLWIKGNLVNNGIVRSLGRGLALDVTGNVTAIKPFTNNRVQLAGNGNRTIVDQVSQVTYLSTGEKVILYGDNYLPNLTVGTGSKCQLASGGNIYVPDNAIDEKLDNWSVISFTRKLSSAQTNSFFKARVTVIPNSGIDSLKVSSFGHQVPARFANAVRTWYRLDRTPKTATSNISTLTMYYSDEELGQNIEANLQVYYSADSGKTWRQVSTSLNLTRNASQNYVTISDVASIGDYLLSSSPDPVSVRPSVMVSLMGRTQIRVGPPNQYTVQYVNNSDVETGDMLLQLSGTGGVHIRSVTPSPQPGYTSTAIPVDSLTYDGDDTSVLLWVMSMAPREERTFSLIATATPGLGKSSSSAELITLTTVVVYVGVGLIVDWATDAITNGTEAAYATKVPKGQMWNATKQAMNETYQKQKIGKEWREEPAKKVFGEVAEKLTEHFYGVVLWPVKLGKVLLVDCVGGAIRGARRYVGGDAVEQAEVFMEEGAKPLQKVTSWDPNQKIGPDGYGTQQFISTIGRMNYQILFENKKEATAPAYTIVVVDTLQADFDSSSVAFEKTSHDGPAYNWQMTKNGNILKWRIDAIELPPNVNPPEGEGYVSFSVKPKNGTVSGTILKNTATITFDINAPIRTNQVMNTLDLAPPTTVMKSIPQKLTSNTIVVKWQATDGTGGSGVASATVFASKDGGPYFSVGTSSADSLVFSAGSGSHKYAFYALAKDNVGNVESVRPAPVASDIVNDVEEKVSVPTEFSLSQNYPNPFNPTTEIAFSLSVKVRATLRIYDMLGREIATLVDEEKNPGKYSLRWDARGQSSGVYFYRLIAGDFVQTRKLTLIK